MVRVVRKTLGLSIAETVVAASLLCLLLIGVLNLLPSTLTTVSYVQQRQTAALLAQDSLNVVAARPFDTLNLGTQDTSVMPVPSNMTLTVTVSEVTGYSTDFLKCVTAEVSFDYRGSLKTIKQELYVHPAKT
ncbi:MAG: hypothetical protein KC800_27125 [Candidatus Eremiobacteraeota bacterium]|nr:hypothetical protein [Candidatus Eremiobacteraeota bacterium]